MNIQLSKNTLNLLAKCETLQAQLTAMEEMSPSDINIKAHSLLWETLSSNARMLAMSLQADKENTK